MPADREPAEYRAIRPILDRHGVAATWEAGDVRPIYQHWTDPFDPFSCVTNSGEIGHEMTIRIESDAGEIQGALDEIGGRLSGMGGRVLIPHAEIGHDWSFAEIKATFKGPTEWLPVEGLN